MKSGFKKFVSDGTFARGCRTPLSKLLVDEIWFYPEEWGVNTKLYNRVYQHARRTGKTFEHMEIKNGTLIKRCA